MIDVAVEGQEDEANDAGILPIRAEGIVPLVALGGSVGATAALQEFFKAVGSNSGLAFAVVMNRGVDERNLGKALRDSTLLRVVQVARSQPIRPDTIYLIAPGLRVRTANNSLEAVSDEADAEHSPYVALDQFLRCLATSHGPRAAAVILSGDEPDGAIGIKRIKEHGGLTIAQEPQEAAGPRMPRSAIATGMVDWVLPAAEMAARLRDYFSLARHLQLPAEESPSPAPAAQPDAPAGDEATLNNVLTLLRDRTGRDFSGYKRATIVRRIARRMRQSAAMKALLDDLLDVSRLRLGRLQLRRADVTLAAVVENALEATRPLVEAARHTLTVQLPPQQVELDADPLRLGQVLSNLLGNAVKYTPQGGRIDLSSEIVGAEVVLTVSDTGIGMEAGEIDRMFDLFSQAPEALYRASGGLGIGLALARSIIEMHGGWISASSPGPGKGSQFKVGIPFRQASMVPSAEPVPEPEAVPQDSTRGLLVLIADDNADAAWGLAKLLELSGFRTLLASGGEEALRVGRRERPAVVVLDIGMPDLSGHEVARRIRGTAWGRETVLIAATGWGQDADLKKSGEAGFDVHLTKPLNLRKLKEVISEQLARRRASR